LAELGVLFGQRGAQAGQVLLVDRRLAIGAVGVWLLPPLWSWPAVHGIETNSSTRAICLAAASSPATASDATSEPGMSSLR
jgi:hypothetical protein